MADVFRERFEDDGPADPEGTWTDLGSAAVNRIRGGEQEINGWWDAMISGGPKHVMSTGPVEPRITLRYARWRWVAWLYRHGVPTPRWCWEEQEVGPTRLESMSVDVGGEGLCEVTVSLRPLTEVHDR